MSSLVEDLNHVPSPAEAGRLGDCGIVIADAGSAAHVVAWLPHLTDVVGVFSTGWARGIPAAGELRQFQDAASVIDACEWLLVGSGWTPQLADSVRAARRADRLVLSVLDHWVNYRVRFGPDPLDLPDAVIVTDPYAREIAGSSLPGVAVLEWPNTLADDIGSATASLRQARDPAGAWRVLVIAEPLAAGGGHGPERSVLARLPDVLGPLNPGASNVHIALRLHPIEADDKYDSIRAEWPSTVSVASARDSPLAEQFAWADAVVGFNSYALYLASHCGLPTYTLARRAGVETTLPVGIAVPL
ncbi:MAG: hypothetical protein U0990_02540 [Candidatus Nanopelagicales bacterium]|nr:hypothetical protein [Candidatus Nanopelagicales bacterium]MDZ4248949.1 hypothetical protein [Candidatus Nanopelagicales bacterium]